MLAPWPLATLSGTNPAFMERDESQIILHATLAGKKGIHSPEPTLAQQQGENNLHQTEWEGARFRETEME